MPLGVAALCFWLVRQRPLPVTEGWSGYVLLGALVSAASAGLLALRFRRVMGIVGVRLSALDALRINTRAMFYGFFVPLGGGTDLARFIQLRRAAGGADAWCTAGGLVLDHLVGLATLLALAAGLLLALEPLAGTLDPRLVAAGAGLAGILALLAGAGVWRGRAVGIRGLLRRLPAHKGAVLEALALSLGMQLLAAAAVFVGSRGWHIDIGYAEVLFALAGSLVFHGVPIGLAGLGVADLAGTGLYLAMGLPAADAVLLASLLYFYRVLIALAGGIWQLVPAARPLA